MSDKCKPHPNPVGQIQHFLEEELRVRRPGNLIFVGNGRTTEFQYELPFPPRTKQKAQHGS